MELAAANPARRRDDARGIFLLLLNQNVNVIRVGFQVAGHDDEMAAAGYIESIPQRSTQKGQFLLQHHDQFAQLILELRDHLHGLGRGAFADHDNEFPDEFAFNVVQYRLDRLPERNSFVDYRQDDGNRVQSCWRDVGFHHRTLDAASGMEKMIWFRAG